MKSPQDLLSNFTAIASRSYIPSSEVCLNVWLLVVINRTFGPLSYFDFHPEREILLRKNSFDQTKRKLTRKIAGKLEKIRGANFVTRSFSEGILGAPIYYTMRNAKI